jgi:hypothetical protein
LTDEEQRTLRLAVNRLGENGEWDRSELKIECEELILTHTLRSPASRWKRSIKIVLNDAIEGAE